MPIEKEKLEKIIAEKFPEATFTLTDIIGDMDHYSLEISSPDFKELKLLAAHRLINERLKEYIGGKVHAFTISRIN